MDTRKCEKCQKAMPQARPRQRFCSKACAVRIDVPSTKKCANAACGILLWRKRYGKTLHLEPPALFRRRKFCSARCRVIGATKVQRLAHRNCPLCGERLHRKQWPDGKREGTLAFRRRRFCDVECALFYAEQHGRRERFILRGMVERRRAA
jgi:endogenous inhibitor of DNA gyrase (YacG/DUF329 family)